MSGLLAQEYGWQNVVDGNGVGLAITGMLIVFAALTLVTLIIAAMPRLLASVNTVFPEPASPTTASKPGPVTRDDGEIIAAIGMVLHQRGR